MLFSLPTQRCFPKLRHSNLQSSLFSAYAEVFPLRKRFGVQLATFLCLRRGVSRSTPQGAPLTCFSLPTQRCFQAEPRNRTSALLFSAYAEVFPVAGAVVLAGTFFSLPTQRCFPLL